MKDHRTKTAGLSLVELSIVLVVIGLLVGSIMTGRSLIRSSQLRTVSTDYYKYSNAVQLFFNEFNAMPGDMKNATDYWGAAHANATTCITTVGSGITTCNGNGDGYVNGAGEPFRFWQHLSNAGLIEGKYTGVTDGTYTWSGTAKNVPLGKIPKSAWFAFSWGITNNYPTFFDGDYHNALQFGGIVPNSDPSGLVLETAEAFNIDTKIDDGKPGLGKIRSQWENCTNASAGNQGATATYLIRETDLRCKLFTTSIGAETSAN